MMLDYVELFKPYTRDGHTLTTSFKYWEKEAATNNIPADVLALAMQEIFTEAANGREFPLDKCPCGCGIDKAGTAITHAIRDRMLEISVKLKLEQTKLLNDRHNTAILGHIHRQNEQFLADNLKPKRLLDWNKSPIVRIARKINGLVRHSNNGMVPDTDADK